MPTSSELSNQELLRHAWEIGVLDWKLWDYQLTVHDQLWRDIQDPDCSMTSVVQCRQSGKSLGLRLVATEYAIRNPECQINIAGPIAKEMRKVNSRVMRILLRDCPDDLRPRFNATDGKWTFPNKSEVFTCALNNGHEDDQRGNVAHLNIIDEAGFVDRLDYCLVDVYGPQTDRTGGTTALCSTPPKSPAHEFNAIRQSCERAGRYSMLTIDDTNYSEKNKAKIAERCGGVQSTAYRREYLCEFIVDSALSVVPDWRKEYEQEVVPGDLHEFWHRYEAMDLGVRDNTVCLFAYYDFLAAKLIVEDEFVANGPDLTTPKLVAAIRRKEEVLKYEKLHRRVADNNNLQLLNDLAVVHGMPFHATSKDELPAMVNHLRTLVQQGRVIVHPRCKNLIGCLQNGIWKGEEYIGREFGRARELGHYDALAALIYLARNLDLVTNPIPAGWGLDPGKQYIPAHMLKPQLSPTAKALQGVFGRRRTH